MAGWNGRLAFSLNEASEATGLSRSHLTRVIAAGELRSMKVGRRRLIPASEMRRLVGEDAA
ncbi:DNA binding domain protein, excisionase family [Sphingobium chlorophenolicum L-1]|uniref:DNA binding domain protein, excisionase family n=1 Tax=Sphingobium chlorophenolicum L-1 TaxID=690566 RepID=F6F2V4_SPHCR|nr:DNA binding domain protein, excisionase family [Sphingobium chlorophenolicum L-1]